MTDPANRPTRPAAAPVDGTPARLGRYALGRTLGQGGMARVVEATDTQLGRTVALKLLDPARTSAELVARFRREAELTARLRHPGIVAVHQVGEARDAHGRPLHFIAMERVDGGSYAEALAAGMPLDRRLEVLTQVAAAVGHAHAEGVVHRDLKPANVLLDGDGRARVADFGLARADDLTQQLTATGQVLGTVHYMSPEQVRGEPVDARTDVWALGVMLHEALTGAPPFDGDTGAAVMDAILHGAPPTLQTVDGASAALRAVVETALAREPARRYPDARALAAELARFRAGRPLRTRPTRRTTRLGRGLLRQRWQVLTAAAAAALLVVVAVVGWRARASRQVVAGAREAALRALTAGRPAQALEAVSRGLAIAPGDDALRALQARARDAQAHAAAAVARGDRQGDRSAALRAELAPLARQIETLRSAFYRPDEPVAEQIGALRKALEQLEWRIADDARLADQVELRRLLGAGWVHVDDPFRAEPHLERAVALAPDDPQLHAALGRLYLDRTLSRRVAGEWRIDLKQGVDNAEQIAAAARHLTAAGDGWQGARPLDRARVAAYQALAAGDEDGCRRRCQTALATHGDQPGAEGLWILLGWLASGAERMRAWDRALAIRPHHAPLRSARAASWVRAGQPAKAEPETARALATNPHVFEAHSTRAMVLLLLGRHTDAERAIAAGLRRFPDHAVLRGMRGIVRHYVDRLDEALADLDFALANRPDRAPALLYYRAFVRLRLGQLRPALTDIEAHLTLQPDQAPGYSIRAQLKSRLGDKSGALADFAKGLAIDPNSHDLRYNRALERDQQGDAEGALADLEVALRVDPGFASAWNNRGSIRMRRGQLAQALADFDRCLAIDPRQPVVLRNRAMARLRLRKPAEALVDFDRSIRLAPADAISYLQRAKCHLALRDSASATGDLDRAIGLKPDYGEAFRDRGRLRLQAGRRTEALADFRSATRLTPNDWASWYLLGDLQVALGQRDVGVAAIRRARDLGPPRARALLDKRLAELGAR